MQAGLPVLACTDPNTNIGKVIIYSGFSWWCESNDVDSFSKSVEAIMDIDSSEMGKIGMQSLTDNYSVEKAYRIITKKTKR